MKDSKIQQLGDILNLDGLKKPEVGVRAILGEKGGNLLYREFSGLADKIEGSENVEVDDVKSLIEAVKENLREMSVNYFGDEMTLEQFQNIENLHDNTRACSEIEEAGTSFAVGRITYLPLNLATKLAAQKFAGDKSFKNLKNLPIKVARELVKFSSSIHFPGLKKIDKDLASVLAMYKGNILGLKGLQSLAQDEAAALANYGGSHLDLDSLRTMSPAAVAELARCKAKISLSGIYKLDLEIAQALSNHKGGLSFGNLEELTSDVAAELAKTGDTLQLWSVRSIDKETARELGNFHGYLGLPKLEDMDEEIAKGLANQQGVLYLIGLKEFKPGVAAALGKHRGGGMVFQEITKITEDDARGLAQHKDGMRMAGLTDLSEESARILGESGVEMSRLPEKTMAMINKYCKEPLK